MAAHRTVGPDSFGARGTIEVAGQTHEVFRLDVMPDVERLPMSLKVLLENQLRTEDGANVTGDHVRAVSDWDAAA